MSRSYTTTTATASVPVTVRFVCPKCGREAEVRASVYLSAEATARGYGNTAAEEAAREKLTETADRQLDAVAEQLVKGDLNRLVPEDARSVTGGIRCPHCCLRQLPDVPGKRPTLYPKGFFWKLVGAFAAAAFVSGMLSELARGGTVPEAVGTYGKLLIPLLPGAMMLLNRARSTKAYVDPALMEKRYRSALNGSMEATLTNAVGRTRIIPIPRKG